MVVDLAFYDTHFTISWMIEDGKMSVCFQAMAQSNLWLLCARAIFIT